MKITQIDRKPMFVEEIRENISVVEDSIEIPQENQVIRTKRSQTEGKVQKVVGNEVFFHLADGRLMKTNISNVIVVEKLADEDDEVMEDELDEVSNELLSRYKTAAGKDASAADKKGDYEHGTKRFKGIVKATNKQFDNDKKNNVKEGRFEFDKKSGGIRHNTEDSDQRHGLYIDGKLVKTLSTKDQAENMKSRDPKYRSAEVKKIAEAGQGGLNRCAPAQDVSHEHDLEDVYDKWKGDTVKVKEAGPYAHKFNNMIEASFTDILNKQHAETQASKPKTKVVDIPFHGWTIRYRPGETPGKSVPWMILDRKGVEKKRGESLSDKEAVGAAEEWIKTGGGTTSQARGHVTIDFNKSFMSHFTPENETFYAKVESNDNTPMLYMSFEPQTGFKTSHLSAKKPQPVISLSDKECNNAKLQPNGRYVLGGEHKEGNISKFPLILQSISQSSSDKMRMSEPGITVAANREEVNEISKSTLGSYIKKASKDVSDRSNEVGWKAGVANPKYNNSDDTHKEVKRHQGIGRAVNKLSK